MGDSHVGLQARLMSQALRKLTPVVSKNNCVVIFINQLRERKVELCSVTQRQPQVDVHLSSMRL